MCVFRARSVFERTIDVDYTNVRTWLKYAEMEMKVKNVNRARNIWDRACTLLPRVHAFWYKYIHMEDMLGNYSAVRRIFERWMKWQPEEQAWITYINWEKRNGETDRVRNVRELCCVSVAVLATYLSVRPARHRALPTSDEVCFSALSGISRFISVMC